jgi:hypothetical protein
MVQRNIPLWAGAAPEIELRGCANAPLPPLKKAAAETDKRLVEDLLELSDGVTGRIIEVLRRAAFQAIAH